jgi:hypothetical protein
MSFFYLIALLPILVGLALLAKHREVMWQEVLGSSALAFFLAGVFHMAAVRSQVGDTETWSGQISRAVHYPRWVERYTTTSTDKDGKTTTETHYRTHSEHWEAETTTDDEHPIDREFFYQISKQFGGITAERPHKSGFYSGDRNIYVAYNKTGFVYPTTTSRSFENRLRAVPNLFQFSKPPMGARTYPYPKNRDWLSSNRIVGHSGSIPTDLLDQMNSRLGPTKKVNVILVGFKDTDATAGHHQQATWAGGKKNDLVICYDVSSPPSWAYCFGWTESEITKRNIESIVLQSGVTPATLKLIEQEIVNTYVIKDWKKFDYINIPPPSWALVWFPIMLIATQLGYWMWATNNEYSASGRFRYR